MGAIIAGVRKRFSRRHFLSLLYAQAMIDVLPLPWESPRPRVPEQRLNQAPLFRATKVRQRPALGAPGAGGEAGGRA